LCTYQSFCQLTSRTKVKHTKTSILQTHFTLPPSGTTHQVSKVLPITEAQQTKR
jgi:hypothetical protein